MTPYAMTTEALKPCPFCGSKVRVNCDDYSARSSQKCYIECQSTDCLMPEVSDLDYDVLVFGWNCRAAEAELLTARSQIEALETAHDTVSRALATASARVRVLEAENARLVAVIAKMDAHTPRADKTCDEPGITFSQAVMREWPDLAPAINQEAEG